jgi:uncharacterized protein
MPAPSTIESPHRQVACIQQFHNLYQGAIMPGKYILSKATNGQFFFNLHAVNGERILTSELYTTKAAALNGIESVKVNSPIDSRYERFNDKASMPRFNLKAANAQVIGVSESYSSTSARDQGIVSCKSNGPAATTEDRT